MTLGTQKQAPGLKKMSASLDVKQITPGHLQEGREHTLLVAMGGGSGAGVDGNGAEGWENTETSELLKPDGTVIPGFDLNGIT